jgi:enoyl-CoA hydratase
VAEISPRVSPRTDGRALVRTEIAKKIATLVLDDPDRRNALSWEMVRALYDALERVTAANCRALILRHTAPVFSAGGSLDDLLAPKVPLDEMYIAFRALDALDIPSVAIVDGPAVGAGINLALACDVTLCTPEASFDVRFLDVGIHPGGGQLWRLRQSVNQQTVAALTLFGETVRGEEAARVGLVWRCVPRDGILEEATALAERAASRDPELVARVKSTMRQLEGVTDPEGAIALERSSQRWSMERPVFAETLRGLRDRLGRGHDTLAGREKS